MDPRDNIPPFLALQEQLAPAQARRRRERAVRIVLWTVLGGLSLIFLTLLVVSRIDPNSFRGRIEAAVQEATGRDFRIRGGIRIVSWRSMTIVADDVFLANAPWGSRPEMLTLGRIEADVALQPLFSGLLRLPRLALYDADLILERNAQGQGNWQFTRARPASAAPAAGQTLAQAAEAADGDPPFAVRTVHVRDARIQWVEAPGAAPLDLVFKRITTSENLRENNVSIGADFAWRGQAINVSGQAGSLIRLMDPSPPAAGEPLWGIVLNATVPGAKLTVAGSLLRPLQGKGLSLRVEGVATDLAGVSAVIGRRLPPLRGVTFAAQITDPNNGPPQVQNIAVQVGTSDLAALVPGLKLERLSLSARSPEDTILAELRGTITATDLRATGRFGTLAQLVDPARAVEPFPVEINASLGESTLSLAGTAAPFGDPAVEGDGPTFDLALAVKLRDLADMSVFAGRRLPTQRPVTFEGRVATIAGAEASAPGVALRGASLRMPLAELDGDVDVFLGARPDIRTVLRGRKLDIDGLVQAISKIPLGGPSTELPKGALPIRRTERPVISDTPFDLAGIDAFDADVSLGLDEMGVGGLVARGASVRLLLKDGALRLSPFAGTLPGGAFSLALSMDSRVAEMPVALRVAAPALDVRPLLLALGRTEDISGLVEVDADLRATGRSPHDLVSTMTGHLGMAMVDGMVDNALMLPLLGGVMRVARVPSDVLFGPGRSRVRCFALRMNATDGVGQVGAMALDVGRALVQGSGTIQFKPEMLNLRLQPLLRITSTGITVPLKLTDRFRSPAIAVDEGGIASEALGALSALSGRVLGTMGNRGGDACVGALAAARAGGGTSVLPADPPPPNLFPHISPVAPKMIKP